jgi:4-amino-4-deoxy-L-arabinose transferase-like glycosyltransferase
MLQPSADSSELQSKSAAMGWLAQPGGWLAILVCAQLLFWTLTPWLVASSLPLDVVSDGLSWGHEWQWGYYKHPPLPSWMAELSFDAFGSFGPFLLSQLAIAATYIFVFLLGRAFMPGRWAATGALLLAGVYYFSVPTPEFNHNVAQMPLWAAASYFYYRAWKSGALRWWAALGTVAGLGLLAKYSTGVLLAAMLAHFLTTPDARSRLSRAGPYIAVLISFAVVSPHLLWLLRTGFPTLHYAAGRAGNAGTLAGRIVAPVRFLFAQAIDVAPAILAAAIGGLLFLRPAPSRPHEHLRFLLFLTLGPALLTCLISLATGLGARDMWGAPMWNLTGLVLVEAARTQWDSARLQRLAVCICGFFVVGLLAFLLTNVFVPERENRPSRIQWPAKDMSETFAATWTKLEHRSLEIVAADGWTAGLVAMDAQPRPSVWIDGSFAKSPWITPDRVAQDGALVLWRIHGDTKPPAPGLCVMGVKAFAWPFTPRAKPLLIGYGIVPPRGRPQ